MDTETLCKLASELVCIQNGQTKVAAHWDVATGLRGALLGSALGGVGGSLGAREDRRLASTAHGAAVGGMVGALRAVPGLQDAAVVLMPLSAIAGTAAGRIGTLLHDKNDRHKGQHRP